ncbi:MAG: bifunctional phosphopantothenoylcysteine decarboxylase/phosphopantothenate--cysteine ligase CoaBC, partial [Planctomycetota bacterium]
MSFKTERAPKPLCIILGVTGSIAAYKAAEIASTLHQRGHDVHVVMTPSAQKLVTAATFHPLTGNPVHKDLWDEASLTGQARVTHVDLADRADVFAIAPATANTIGKIAHGIADSFLTTLLLAYPGKVLVAPAMNDNMFAHPSVQKNLETLRGFGYRMVAPGQGALACGREGLGRLADPEAIVRAIEALGAGKPTGPEHGGAAPRRVLVTAGPTREPIDAVRVLQNPSSGRMGDAIAAALAARGHEVTLVRGPIDRPAPSGLAQVVPVTTTRSMFEACQRVFPSVDAVIMAAAPCDWRAPAPASEKL